MGRWYWAGGRSFLRCKRIPSQGVDILTLTSERQVGRVSGLAVATSLGLAGLSGVRGGIPLLTLGLLQHYTNLVRLQPGFARMGGPGWLFILLLVSVVESAQERLPGFSLVGEAIPKMFRLASGGIVAVAVFGGAVPFLTFLGGCLLAWAVGAWVKVIQEEVLRFRIRDSVAVVGVLLAIIFPWLVVTVTAAALGVLLINQARAWFPGFR